MRLDRDNWHTGVPAIAGRKAHDDIAPRIGRGSRAVFVCNLLNVGTRCLLLAGRTRNIIKSGKMPPEMGWFQSLVWMIFDDGIPLKSKLE